MNRRKIIVATFAASLFVALSAFALSVAQRPGIKELMSNREYVELLERSEQLSLRADSVNTLLAERRALIADTVEGEDVAPLRREIIALEQLSHDLSIEQGGVTRRIGEIEQAHIMNQLLNNQEHVVVGEIIDDADMDHTTTALANLVDNECFKQELKAEDYADLLRAQREESEMVQLAARYAEAYAELKGVAEEYAKADRASVAEPLYARYVQLSAELEELDKSMNDKWNHILDAKYFAMAYILEKSHRYDILDRASNNYQAMQQRCAMNDGVYASDALMRYALGRRTLLGYEWEFARDMRLKPAQDSLRGVLDGYTPPVFSLQRIELEQGNFMDYAKVKIGRTNYYDEESNPLPELRVFESGVIYRISLGRYRNKQTMTLFKGVQPMSVERSADGMYCYYAGGYATEQEARDDMQFLEGKGLKSLEICCWKDGTKSTLSKPKSVSSSEKSSSATKPSTPKVQYMVVVRADAMNDKMRSVIRSAAAGKSISRNGNTYIIGLFRERGEADVLLTTLSENFPTLEMAIQETKVE